MKVCAVIVTYGDRFKFLKQVIDACIREGVNKIIVVDNASEENSRNALKEYEKKLKDKLKVIYFDTNTGSAGGYKRGLEEAYKCEECEFVLTLDDDNILRMNSLLKIKELYDYMNDAKNIIFAMYRPIWEDNKKVILYGDKKTQNIRANNFMGFNFLSYIKYVITKTFKIKQQESFFPLNPVNYNEMGGLIFHKSVLEAVGYPNEIFFVYTDDIEFTYRMTQKNYKIFLCANIQLDDIDATYSDKNGNKISYFHPEFSEFKMYYLLRNRAYYSKKFISNKLIFYFNGFILCLLFAKNIFKTKPSLFFKRYKLFLKAVYDGLTNKMGKRL